jgi:hypothetical protein
VPRCRIGLEEVVVDDVETDGAERGREQRGLASAALGARTLLADR